MKILDRGDNENRKSAQRGARAGGHVRVPVPATAIVLCDRCRRKRKPRGNETSAEYSVRKWCDEPDCRDHALSCGYITPKKPVERSHLDTPDIPRAGQWGFAAAGWRG